MTRRSTGRKPGKSRAITERPGRNSPSVPVVLSSKTVLLELCTKLLSVGPVAIRVRFNRGIDSLNGGEFHDRVFAIVGRFHGKGDDSGPGSLRLQRVFGSKRILGSASSTPSWEQHLSAEFARPNHRRPRRLSGGVLEFDGDEFRDSGFLHGD